MCIRDRPGDVYNISSEMIYTMRAIVTFIATNLNHSLEIVVDEALLRPTDERVIVGDVTKLKRDTKWMQCISMEQTITDMLNYWRKVLPLN